jgi:hypothetical protein
MRSKCILDGSDSLSAVGDRSFRCVEDTFICQSRPSRPTRVALTNHLLAADLIRCWPEEVDPMDAQFIVRSNGRRRFTSPDGVKRHETPWMAKRTREILEKVADLSNREHVSNAVAVHNSIRSSDA